MSDHTAVSRYVPVLLCCRPDFFDAFLEGGLCQSTAAPAVCQTSLRGSYSIDHSSAANEVTNGEDTCASERRSAQGYQYRHDMILLRAIMTSATNVATDVVKLIS